jgi:hypothetical protein
MRNWDRLFGSAPDTAEPPQLTLPLELAIFQDAPTWRLSRLPILPLRKFRQNSLPISHRLDVSSHVDSRSLSDFGWLACESLCAAPYPPILGP